MAGVQIVGARKAARFLAVLAEHAQQTGTVRVGASAPYAYGIETGQKKGGGLARRAGGVWYLSRAYDAVKPRIPKLVSAALGKGEDALEGLKRAGFQVEEKAKGFLSAMTYSPRTRYRTRSLMRSVQTVYPGRPVMPFDGGGTRRSVRPR